jgi:hypothetical protein
VEADFASDCRHLAVSNSNKSCCLRRWWPLFWRSGKGKYSIPYLFTSGINNTLRFQGHIKLLSFRKLNSISWDIILYRLLAGTRLARPVRVRNPPRPGRVGQNFPEPGPRSSGRTRVRLLIIVYFKYILLNNVIDFLIF